MENVIASYFGYEVNNLNFHQTCSACPEQYDVYDENNSYIGYVRLRWGELRADYIDEYQGIEEEVFFEKLDDFQGNFINEEQRSHYLNEIATVLNEWRRYNVNVEQR